MMLEGNLVRLRALEPSDLERVYSWINDREVTRYIAARYPMSRADEERWLRGSSPNSFGGGVQLAIEVKNGEVQNGGTNEVAHIGNIDLVEVRPEDRKAGLGVMIGDKDYWSNGYGTDAVVTILRFAFHEMNLNRVWLHAFDFNERAQACYRKCGFQEEGRLREHYYTEGRYCDSVVMAVLRHEFEALYGVGETAVAVAANV
ncbi:MAG: GNAT family N-acetyltransferase [Chloroflexi bacterium]|nr:GNAT family N-acetyltransferase [Chloroflexota bacterium]